MSVNIYVQINPNIINIKYWPNRFHICLILRLNRSQAIKYKVTSRSYLLIRTRTYIVYNWNVLAVIELR